MCFSDAEHEASLHNIGWTVKMFTDACRKDGAADDEETCRICFDQRIDAVILPCGHFAICSHCGSGLAVCPICRVAISKVQLIYRS